MPRTADHADNTDKILAHLDNAGSKSMDLSFEISVPPVVSVVTLLRYNWCFGA